MEMNQHLRVEKELKLDLDILPYPAQSNIVRHLRSCSDDILNLGKAFPSLVSVANISKPTWIFDKIFPVLVPYLAKKDSLNCRLVCHTWMQVIDNFLQNLGLAEFDYGEPERSLSSELEYWSKDAFGMRSCWFENSRHVSNFMEKMGDHPKNPFISRCVQINNQNDARYWTDVGQFLQQFGHEIWKLRLGVYCCYPRATVIIRDILARVPNLKMLSLEYNGIDRPDLDLTPERLAQIRRDLADNEFPPLPNLQFLDWGMCEYFYNAALPRYSQHLVHGRFMDTEFMEAFNYNVHGTFPNLKTLVVRINDDEDLSKLQQLRSPLKSVTTVSSQRIPLHTYLHVFHHFSGTLESFNIEYDDEEEEENLFHFRVENQNEQFLNEDMEFPQLKCVRFENPDPMESFDSLQFLKPGPSCLQIQTYILGWLEDYRNYQRPLFEEMPGEIVEIHGYLENMYDSKIWDVMPQLETFHVKVYNPMNRKVNRVYERSKAMGQKEDREE